MKLIEAALFIFYEYYRKRRWERVPVFHASASLSLLIGMNAASIACFAGRCEMIFQSQAIVLITLMILFGIIYLVAKKSNLPDMYMRERSKKVGGKFLLIYITISIAVLFYGFVYYAASTKATLIKPIK